MIRMQGLTEDPFTSLLSGTINTAPQERPYVRASALGNNRILCEVSLLTKHFLIIGPNLGLWGAVLGGGEGVASGGPESAPSSPHIGAHHSGLDCPFASLSPSLRPTRTYYCFLYMVGLKTRMNR